MAYVKLTTGQTKTLTAEQGHEIWRVLNSETEGTEDQQKFCAQIEKFYLNWRNAPNSYLEARADILKPMVIQNFMREPIHGDYTRPEPTDKDCLRVAKFYGLIEHGQMTRTVHEFNLENRKHPPVLDPEPQELQAVNRIFKTAQLIEPTASMKKRSRAHGGKH